MQFEWNEIKNDLNLEKHGLPFEMAAMVFAGFHLTKIDERRIYGETRFLTMGTLGFYGRVVIIAHTYRDHTNRIISMRKANSREQKIFQKALDKQ